MTNHPLRIHEIYLPWTTTLNPHYEQVRKEIVELLNKLELCDKKEEQARRDGVFKMGAYIYPSAGAKELYFGIIFILWLFFFDDIFDEIKCSKEERDHTAKRTLEILRTQKSPSQPASKAILQLEKLLLLVIEQAHDLCHDQTVISRFLENCKLYITEGAIPMDNLRLKKKLPTLQEYLAVRNIDGAIDACLSCYEIVAHLSLPEEIVNEPKIRRMCDLTGYQIVCSNDIYSYHREKLHNNSINCLNIRSTKKKFEEALIDQIEQLNGWVREFQGLKQSLSNSPLKGESLDVYITGMQDFMAGCKVWSESCTRYDLKALLPSEN